MTARWQTGTVACGGEEIYYEVTGDDDLPAIMLTHGMGGTHAAWFQQVPTLAANGFRVITWDCRGFGNSTFTSGVHGSAAAVADMAAVLDATGTPGAHLVGQSMGGWWVTAFTVAHPARTHSLTLSNTVGGLWTTALLEYFREWMTKAAANFGAEQRIGAHWAISPTTRPRPRLPLPRAEHLPHAPDRCGRRRPDRRRGRAQRPRRHRRSRPRDHKHRRRAVSAAPCHRQRAAPRQRVYRRGRRRGPLDVLRAARPLQRRVDRVHRESGTMSEESEAVTRTGNTPR
jgi:pimeloyl-ACP methyl ester carboxylesterase